MKTLLVFLTLAANATQASELQNNCSDFAKATFANALSMNADDFSFVDEYTKVEQKDEYTKETFFVHVNKNTPERYRVFTIRVYWAEQNCILGSVENTRRPFQE